MIKSIKSFRIHIKIDLDGVLQSYEKPGTKAYNKPKARKYVNYFLQ